ncbi:hypothetical protein [Mycobacterium intracellulare]|uniref:hypothetical protein n=1 Tax=Mycobacterium intracellulare TaxID=1767 RepID=UPI0030C88E42
MKAARVAAVGRPRWRFVAAMGAIAAAVAVWVLVFGGHSHLRSQLPASLPAHTMVSSLGSEFTVTADHLHLFNASPPAVHHYEAFVAGVLADGPGAAVAALGVVAAAVAVVSLLWQQAMVAGRGPPRGLPAALTGQDLLTRFCLSRR